MSSPPVAENDDEGPEQDEPVVSDAEVPAEENSSPVISDDDLRSWRSASEKRKQ